MIYLPPNEKEHVSVDYSLPDDPAYMSEDDKKYVKVVKTPLCSSCFGPLKFDVCQDFMCYMFITNAH